MSITPAPCRAREVSQTGSRELRMDQVEPSGPITCETMRIRTFNLIFFAAGRCLERNCMRQHQTQQCVEVELRLTCSVDESKVQSREWSPERNRLLPPTTGSSPGLTFVRRIRWVPRRLRPGDTTFLGRTVTQMQRGSPSRASRP